MNKIFVIFIIFLFVFSSIAMLFQNTGNNSVHKINVNMDNNAVAYVPITLYNNQSTNTSVDFQQMIRVNWSEYSSYLNSNISNVRFFNSTNFSSTTELYAWIENNNTTSATNSVVWINMSNTIIPAGGTATIYMVFYNATTSWDQYLGLAPQLSSNYAQFDNGNKVFNFYDNFAGTSLNSKYVATSGLTITVNNGMDAKTGSTGGQYIYYNEAYSKSSFIIETLIKVIQQVSTQNWGEGGVGITETSPSWASTFTMGRLASETLPEVFVSVGGTTSYSSTQIPLNEFHILGASFSGSEVMAMLDGSNIISESFTTFSSYYLAILSMDNNNGEVYQQYVRTREYPPAGVIPAISFGSVNSATNTGYTYNLILNFNANMILNYGINISYSIGNGSLNYTTLSGNTNNLNYTISMNNESTVYLNYTVIYDQTEYYLEKYAKNYSVYVYTNLTENFNLNFTINNGVYVNINTSASPVPLTTLPYSEEFMGAFTGNFNYVSFFANSTDGYINMSIGSALFKNDVLNNITIEINHTGFYNISVGNISIIQNNTYFINFYDVRNTVYLGYVENGSAVANTSFMAVKDYYYYYDPNAGHNVLTNDTVNPLILKITKGVYSEKYISKILPAIINTVNLNFIALINNGNNPYINFTVNLNYSTNLTSNLTYLNFSSSYNIASTSISFINSSAEIYINYSIIYDTQNYSIENYTSAFSEVVDHNFTVNKTITFNYIGNKTFTFHLYEIINNSESSAVWLEIYNNATKSMVKNITYNVNSSNIYYNITLPQGKYYIYFYALPYTNSSIWLNNSEYNTFTFTNLTNSQSWDYVPIFNLTSNIFINIKYVSNLLSLSSLRYYVLVNFTAYGLPDQYTVYINSTFSSNISNAIYTEKTSGNYLSTYPNELNLQFFTGVLPITIYVNLTIQVNTNMYSPYPNNATLIIFMNSSNYNFTYETIYMNFYYIPNGNLPPIPANNSTYNLHLPALIQPYAKYLSIVIVIISIIVMSVIVYISKNEILGMLGLNIVLIAGYLFSVISIWVILLLFNISFVILIFRKFLIRGEEV